MNVDNKEHRKMLQHGGDFPTIRNWREWHHCWRSFSITQSYGDLIHLHGNNALQILRQKAGKRWWNPSHPYQAVLKPIFYKLFKGAFKK